MKIYVYLDESGSIHKNSKTKYFAVGGYFVFEQDKTKVISHYKKINKQLKDCRQCNLKQELKAFSMQEKEKIMIFSNIQNIASFYGCVKVFNKDLMKKEIIESNIFFNYAVKLIFQDCILPILNFKCEKIEFILSIDNRGVKVGELKNLENYLKTEFCMYNLDFQITYYDSATNYGIQMADLIVNTFYNSFKDKSLVSNVLKIIKGRKFRISLFPGKKIKGRIRKIDI